MRYPEDEHAPQRDAEQAQDNKAAVQLAEKQSSFVEGFQNREGNNRLPLGRKIDSPGEIAFRTQLKFLGVIGGALRPLAELASELGLLRAAQRTCDQGIADIERHFTRS